MLIFTIKDEIIQKLLKLILKPFLDLQKDLNFYGFRPRKNIHMTFTIITSYLKY